MSKRCMLPLFTWTWEPETGQTKVVPVCPIHHGSRVRFGRFGTGIIVICEVGTHLVGLCDLERFEAESEEAKGKLALQNGSGSS
jgi:hypothetical protein